MTNATRLPVLVGLFGALAVSPALAQPAASQFSAATITNAGHALHDVMAINHTYSEQLNQTKDPASRQQIITEDKAKGAEAVNRNGLTVDQYNQVLEAARKDPNLRQKLIDAAKERN
ncbi:MAG: DUF4168 domain-containing protein [Acetobacteraceae bacterium]